MDITKLTVQGFKSFYEKSIFTFGKNITAIVGPNGSGKSNITEAIRFVLGEQSAKSMRGKDTTDLLYRGNTTRATKAKVEIEFEKSKRQEIASRGNIENIFVKNALEKDVVVVSRTVYADGKSEYSMNGVEVRVKDLQEFLLYVHLGNKSSWHISQGEADKVLQANPQERKTIVEDALGLKVYHARINEALRKLEKTKENIREATIKRREIMPELNALSKQVERIKRAGEFRSELETKATQYLSYKKQILENTKKEDKDFGTLEQLQEKLFKLDQDLAFKEKSIYKDGGHDTSFLEREEEKELHIYKVVKEEYDQIESSYRNAENNIQYLTLEDSKASEELRKIDEELANVAATGNDIIFAERDINLTGEKIEENTKKIINSSDLDLIRHVAEETDFTFRKLLSLGSVVNKDNVKQISYLQGIRNRLQEKIQSAKKDMDKFAKEAEACKLELEKASLKLKITSERIENIKKQILEFKYLASETEKELQGLTFERSRLQMSIAHKQEFLAKMYNLEKDFDDDVRQFVIVLGQNFQREVPGVNLSDEEFQSLRRSIERLKIRLEESEVANPDEVMKNFEIMTERDNFLLKEITDLETSMLNLEILITDLKNNLKQEFELGLLHINKVFDSYVKRLFGGGAAKVFVVEIESRRKEGVDVDDESADAQGSGETKEEVKTGIEVEVEIPKKKVKGLQSLSGGERALISIALNFSIINQNPAPFMILDETDAALDEANSKRYGEILEMLKQNTKLIVVTHNRETMHFAD
jgi:chromosome segregation protein